MSELDMMGLQRQSVDIQGQLADGVKMIQDIGQEFEGVKQQLEGMPDGIDPDIQSTIQEVKDEGKKEAGDDIKNVQQDTIEKAKNQATEVKSKVDTKIEADNTATGQLDGINSKYGRGAADRAKQALKQNIQLGEDILSAFEQAHQKADSDINSVVDNL